jgi:methylated-DNA-[protein]-cysteine S-methyltransferase
MRHAAEKIVTAYAALASPVGTLLIGGDGHRVLLIGFPEGPNAVIAPGSWTRDDTLYPVAREQLTEYFAGRRRAFDFIMAMTGTDFQKSVWQALLEIPFGVTRTYAALAGAIERPKAVRAVGAANGANPLPIAVPCHRLIGADGSLIKFGGGLGVKRYLLDLESRNAA